MRATNHYFRSLKSGLAVKSMKEICIQELLRAESENQNEWGNFMCFVCLRSKPVNDFEKKQVQSRRRKGEPDAAKRFCIDCGIPFRWQLGQYIKSDRTGKMSERDSGWKVFCRKCRKLESITSDNMTGGFCERRLEKPKNKGVSAELFVTRDSNLSRRKVAMGLF